MVWRCVAADSIVTDNNGVSLCSFPKDPPLRKKWTDQVKRTKAKWEASFYSVLSSKHFADQYFNQDSKFSESMELGKRKVLLKSDAIPSLLDNQ